MELAFGPVPSRRLGRSLGINHIPPKHCSYACVYCQVGPTTDREVAPRPFYEPEEVRRQVVRRLEAVRARGEAVDFLAFVPDGEPTLDAQLGAAIDALRELELPIAVISNASLIWREDVRAALGRADWVSLKVDSLDEATWRRVNHPHPDLRLPGILEGIRRFARGFKGRLVSETMLLAGLNDGPGDLAAVGGFLAEAGFHRAYLTIPHRPPTVPGLRAPDEAVLVRAHEILVRLGVEVELLSGHEGEDFAFSGDLRGDILAITAVHPLRESALRALVKKAGADPAAVVAELVEAGALRRVEHAGETFYLRRLPGPRGGPQ